MSNPATWTREDYPRDAVCECGHTAYIHMWRGPKGRMRIDLCDYAHRDPLDDPSCGCEGFRWPA